MPSRSAISAPTPLGVVNTRRAAPRSLARSTDRVQPRPAAWWLWPHLLSLDAPLVAIVWQRWWARSAGVPLAWSHEWILGLGVWLIYLADRLADTASLAFNECETTRHAFYRRRHRAMQPLAAAVFVALICLAPCALPVGQFLTGLGLLSLTGGYFWLVHRRMRLDWPRLVPKEAVVGGMFSLGTGFFALMRSQRPPSELLAALPFFGALCFFNCALITKWEENAQDICESSSLLNAFPRLTTRLDGSCLILAILAFAVVVVIPHGGVFAPVAVSALLLATLDRCRRFLSADALRVLADVVLLTPCMYLAVPIHIF